MRSVNEILEEMRTHDPIFTAWTNTAKENVFAKYAVELDAAYNREIGRYQTMLDKASQTIKNLEKRN